MVRMTPQATTPAASGRAAQRGARPLGPWGGQPAASALNRAMPIAIAPALGRTPWSAPAPRASTSSAGRATTGIATGTSAARQLGSAGSGAGGRRKRSAAPASTARTPAATRNEGSLTSSASSSGSAAAAAAHTMSAPITPPTAATPTTSRRERPARGTPNAARGGLSANSSAAAQSQPDGASSPVPDELAG